MPKFYQRTTDRGLVPEDTIKSAVAAVNDGKSVRAAALEYGIARTTLRNNIKKSKHTENLSPNYKHKLIFNHHQEVALLDYIQNCSKMFYGLTLTKVRALAYEMALVNKIKVPHAWHEKKMAGKDWLIGFRQRHRQISLRQTEATSIARATAFNPHNVNLFFQNLEILITKSKVTGAQIFNLDETGLTTVQKTPKVLAPKGLKQVGQVVSRERGELVTMCAIVSATGQCLPPVFIFPRKKYKDYFLNGAPEGSVGFVSSSGWMTSENFINVLRHFVTHVRPSQEHEVILIMDNHESHMSLECILFAKENHIHILTLPPHTSNKLQPLDRSVFGPLKVAYNALANSWMLVNVGRQITIYQIAEIGGGALLKAATPSNIISGFKASGIWPLYGDIFNEFDFLPSSVSDRPNFCTQVEQNTAPTALSVPGPSIHTPTQPSLFQPAKEMHTSNLELPLLATVQEADCITTDTPSLWVQEEHIIVPPTLSIPGPSTHTFTQSSPSWPSDEAHFNNLELLVLTVAQEINSGFVHHAGSSRDPSFSDKLSNGQVLEYPGSSMVPAALDNLSMGIQSTIDLGVPRSFISPQIFRGYPKANISSTKKAIRKKRHSIIATSSPEIEIIKDKKERKLGAKTKRSLFKPNNSDSDLDYDILEDYFDNTIDSDLTTPGLEMNGVENVIKDDCVLCEYGVKKSIFFYVAIVRKETDEDGDVEVEFLRKSEKVRGKFVKPPVDDIACVPFSNIKCKLTRLDKTGTKRTRDCFFFKENLEKINVR